ncbi:hypothetical protein BJV78DRAFT_165909 [Lactifluus subvellereus]|nr:hypothetical protein BJV78DRAFT_165909 [Lactifluus subvellereus]
MTASHLVVPEHWWLAGVLSSNECSVTSYIMFPHQAAAHCIIVRLHPSSTGTGFWSPLMVTPSVSCAPRDRVLCFAFMSILVQTWHWDLCDSQSTPEISPLHPESTQHVRFHVGLPTERDDNRGNAITYHSIHNTLPHAQVPPGPLFLLESL